MSLDRIFKRLVIPGEVYTLQRKGVGATPIMDEIGDIIETWSDVQDIVGIVQWISEFRDNNRGEEEVPTHNGFFLADFEIPTGDLGEYRIKRIVPNTSPQILYYRIYRIDRDLRYRGKRNHYEMELGENVKW